MNKTILLGLIKDAYERMATNRDENYRASQMKKVNEWLEQLTERFEARNFDLEN
jgi:hypothetical protein